MKNCQTTIRTLLFRIWPPKSQPTPLIDSTIHHRPTPPLNFTNLTQINKMKIYPIVDHVTERLNGNTFEMNLSMGAVEAYKKTFPMKYEKATTNSYVVHQHTTTNDTRWIIPTEKFEETYIKLNDKYAMEKPEIVLAYKMDQDFTLTVTMADDPYPWTYNGNKGEWLLKSGPGEYQKVNSEVFDKTYNRIHHL